MLSSEATQQCYGLCFDLIRTVTHDLPHTSDAGLQVIYSTNGAKFIHEDCCFTKITSSSVTSWYSWKIIHLTFGDALSIAISKYTFPIFRKCYGLCFDLIRTVTHDLPHTSDAGLQVIYSTIQCMFQVVYLPMLISIISTNVRARVTIIRKSSNIWVSYNQ
jgi:hypothetical protein